jgi:hypothetical protein
MCRSDTFPPQSLDTSVTIPFGATPINILKVLECSLNVPPRVSSKYQMSSKEFFKTNNIATARIVVEMKME